MQNEKRCVAFEREEDDHGHDRSGNGEKAPGVDEDDTMGESLFIYVARWGRHIYVAGMHIGDW